MLHNSRPSAAVDSGRRRYDVPGASHGLYPFTPAYTSDLLTFPQMAIPGASLRGPYKLWIPKAENPQSESETEAPRLAPSTSHRSHGYRGPTTTHSTAGNTPATSTSSPRHSNTAPQKHRTERTPLGYTSDSSMPSPPIPASSFKPPSSFNIFKTHSKESGTTNRREELLRSTTAQDAALSRRTTSQTVNMAQNFNTAPLRGGGDGSPSTISSTDPSPRSSTDGSRGGNASAPAAVHQDSRRQSHSTRNPYVDSRVDRTPTSRRNDPSSAQLRSDRKTKDKEDMVAKVTEALGGGSTGKAKAVETALLHTQARVMKNVDPAMRNDLLAGVRGVETQNRSQQQAPPPLRRYQATPQSTPFVAETHLPENPSKSPRPRGPVDVPPRSHGPSEPSAKVPSHAKVSTASSSRNPHPRSASSPWPFNQALPPEPVMHPTKPQAYSSSWKQSFTKVRESTPHQVADSRLPPKESMSYSSSRGPLEDPGRSSQQVYPHAPIPREQLSKSSLPRNSPQSSHPVTTSTPGPLRTMPPPTPASAPSPGGVQTRANPSQPPASTEPPHWSQNAGKPVTGHNGAQQPHNTFQTSWTASSRHPETNGTHQPAPEPAPPPTGSTKRYPVDGTHPDAGSIPVQILSQKSVVASNGGSHSHSESRTLWSTVPKHSAQEDGLQIAPEPAPVTHVRHLSTIMPSATDAPVQVAGRSTSIATTNPPWTTTSRNPETVNATLIAPATVPSITEKMVVLESLVTTAPPAAPGGTWTSKYTRDTYPATDYETDDTSKDSVSAHDHHQTTHLGVNGDSQSPLKQANGVSAPEDLAPGAWMSRTTVGTVSASTFETASVPKPLPKTPSDSPTSTPPEPAPVTPPSLEPTSRDVRYATTNTVSTSQQVTTVAGAWTTSTRYPPNNISVFDSTATTKGMNLAPRETTTRQATLGTTPAAGAWTTKQASGSVTPSSSDATVKHSPTSQTPTANTPVNTPAPSKPLPASGTNTGSNTPSSTEISDLINQLTPVTSHSIATRVPISGHPSTPAPVQPTLRTTPPPLSISSTSPDTDSLLTPSSLNSPRSTIVLQQSHPIATITTADTQHTEKESAPRKNSFFDFFRVRPTKSYEVWMPPAKPGEKERTREEKPNDPAPPPSKPKQSAPVPIPPRPKSPKFFSPLKLFSKRHRTVSTASLDVLDGTAPNTVMNSPASSMRADTPGVPPSPPIRDALLATQEWRNREAAELVVSGRKRRHRPGVTFDCPEEAAPVDILPSRLRIGRIQNEDDDDF